MQYLMAVSGLIQQCDVIIESVTNVKLPYW